MEILDLNSKLWALSNGGFFLRFRLVERQDEKTFRVHDRAAGRNSPLITMHILQQDDLHMDMRPWFRPDYCILVVESLRVILLEPTLVCTSSRTMMDRNGLRDTLEEFECERTWIADCVEVLGISSDEFTDFIYQRLFLTFLRFQPFALDELQHIALYCVWLAANALFECNDEMLTWRNEVERVITRRSSVFWSVVQFFLTCDRDLI
jgi:hypothetical protein